MTRTILDILSTLINLRTALTWTLAFSHFEKSSPHPLPGNKVHLEIRSNFCNVSLNLFLTTDKTCFRVSFCMLIPRYYFYHVWLKIVFIASPLYAN